MPQYQYFTTFGSRYDLNRSQFDTKYTAFDSIADSPLERYTLPFDLRPFQKHLETILFSSDSYKGNEQVNSCFDVRSRQFLLLPQFLNAISYQSSGKFFWTNDFLIRQKNGIAQLWDSIDITGLRTGFVWSNDLLIAYKERYTNTFDSFSIHPFTRFAFAYDFLRLLRKQTANRFNAVPCDYLSKYLLRWDSNKKEFAALNTVHQSLVKDGWKIIARDIATGELKELGFIEADSPNHSLQNIFLPDGDYEISVLTSSLFWQDCVERNIRTISIGDDVDISPLPLIYNLRSSVSQGLTTIQWSANQSGAEDCVFGLWYSAESPVDTNRPPDETVWYFPAQSEYQTAFRQSEKCYAAVAVIRTGDESERGTIHELLLDWNHVPPHSPDDVIVFNVSKELS